MLLINFQLYIVSEYQIAEIFTNVLPRPKLNALCDRCGLSSWKQGKVLKMLFMRYSLKKLVNKSVNHLITQVTVIICSEVAAGELWTSGVQTIQSAQGPQSFKNKMKKIWMYLKNCTFVDISNIGWRFHTSQELHVLGKVKCMLVIN